MEQTLDKNIADIKATSLHPDGKTITQEIQDVAVPAEYVPATQATHAVAALLSLSTVPATQSVQAVAPAAAA